MAEEVKIPASVKKMSIAIIQMEERFKKQKAFFQQMEKEFHSFKKYAASFIDISKKMNTKPPKKPSGFVLPVPISPELCRFLNIDEGSQASRTEVTKFLIQYIQENNLTDPEKKTLVVPDERLSALLGPEVDLESLTRFTMQKYMNKHYCKAQLIDSTTS
jgi:chromatin remodeling complex protein RSC6